MQHQRYLVGVYLCGISNIRFRHGAAALLSPVLIPFKDPHGLVATGGADRQCNVDCVCYRDSWQRCEAVKLVFAWTLLQVSLTFVQRRRRRHQRF